MSGNVIESGHVDLSDWPIIGGHVVYHLDGPGGLYVGVTSDLLTRIAQHRRDRYFGRSITSVAWWEYETRAEANEVEARMIFQLDPPRNTKGRPNVSHA